MNIFILDSNAQKCAQYHNNKHIIKMPTETVQMLSTALILNGINPPKNKSGNLYKSTHVNHPCSKWIRETRSNYLWACDLLIELCKEKRVRYNNIPHFAETTIAYFIEHATCIPNGKLTEFALAMPDKYIVKGDPVQSYRNYYIGDKQHIAQWKNREVPEWFILI